MRKFWQEFKKFISRGNVVDMAVGVTVASAFTAIVTAFTKGFISPLLALLTGNATLADAAWVLRWKTDPTTGEWLLDEFGQRIPDVQILWGGLVQAVIDFLIIALALFTLMRVATAVMKRTTQLRNDVMSKLTDAEEKKAAAEAQQKAEEEAKAQEEAARLAAEEQRARDEAERAAAAAAKAEEEKREAEARMVREEELLREIRDLLKNR